MFGLFESEPKVKCDYCGSIMHYDGSGRWNCSRKKCNCIAYWYPSDPIEELEYDELCEWDYDEYEGDED